MNFIKTSNLPLILAIAFIFGFTLSIASTVNAVESESVSENTYELCTDGIDNDDNGNTDFADASCLPFVKTEESEEPTQPRRSGGSTGGSIPSAPVGDLNSGGEVLGATTEGDSCVMLTTFMRLGMDNNPDQVRLLQSFLNSKMNANLPVTGFFGSMTDAAVRMFQVQYGQQVLLPWVNLGLHSSVNIATGYVYKTTTYTINSMLCPQAEIQYPVLN